MANVSIIVPIYNVEKYLSECLDSILAQTYTDFELILVDDGSSDRSPEICDVYQEKDSRIHVIHRENGGPAAARNTGLDYVEQCSSCTWIGFVDSDDWLHPQYVEILLKSAQQHGAQMCRCQYVEVAEKQDTGAIIEEWKTFCRSPREAYLCGVGSASPCLKLVKKEYWSGIRYPEEKFAEDMYTLYKVFFRCSMIAEVDDVLYYYRINPNSVSRARWVSKQLDEITAFEEQLSYFHERGYVDVEERLIKKYCMVLANHYKAIDNTPMSILQKRHYHTLLRKKYHMLHKAYKTLPPECQWCADTIYPIRATAYWHWQALKNKFCRK